ncbi:MAG TPA: flagellar export protein FliJ [Woeseiaceae bacterium]|nr:flagellar export protein FliJ [Woeseiaceae bacterium]
MTRILAIAEAEERKSAVLAGKVQSRLDEQRSRLGELYAHRHTYAGRTRDISSIPAAQWQDYQRFLGRLDNAVRSQSTIIRDCEKSVATHRRRWMVKRQRLESLQRVLERFREEERVARDRQEQRTLDEMSAGQRHFGGR